MVLLGAAGQFGIFLTLILALLLGFSREEAASIGIIKPLPISVISRQLRLRFGGLLLPPRGCQHVHQHIEQRAHGRRGAIIPPRVDDANNDAPEFDLPDADSVYAQYLETCRRLGVEPVPR